MAKENYKGIRIRRTIGTQSAKIVRKSELAKRINSTGNIYEEDMKEVKVIMDEVWKTQKAM